MSCEGREDAKQQSQMKWEFKRFSRKSSVFEISSSSLLSSGDFNGFSASFRWSETRSSWKELLPKGIKVFGVCRGLLCRGSASTDCCQLDCCSSFHNRMSRKEGFLFKSPLVAVVPPYEQAERN